ncbi:MAG: ATP synthase F1 subunit delta [Schwartzia sp.]|nr:ATP synthase F1 subunit delta [Schwartzia sp. (in: firmicutes)]
MLNLQLATKYSRAMFLLAEEDGKLAQYGAELRALAEAVAGTPELKAFLESPMIPRQAKQDATEKIFAGELSPMVMNFLRMLLDKQRVALLSEIVQQYENFANEAQGILVADVTTARVLSEALGDRLKAKLSELTGKTIKLRKHLDEKLIGGVVVRMGDTLIDGSLKSRMKALEAQLLAD